MQTQTQLPASPALGHILSLSRETGAPFHGAYVHRAPFHPAQYDVAGRTYWTPGTAAAALAALTGSN